jgi:CheY-like chemotaxis protein
MPKQKPGKTGLKILVIDDEPLVCDAVKMLLDFDGHTVDTATTGEQALEMYKPGKFDVIMTDWSMPGIKGDELARKIKEADPKQPVIMITAHAELLKPPIKGVDHIVSKPFLLDDLRQAITQTVVKKRSPSS